MYRVTPFLDGREGLGKRNACTLEALHGGGPAAEEGVDRRGARNRATFCPFPIMNDAERR
jgi:hypothetical protein